MSTPLMFQAPPRWTNQPIRLYHGTIDTYATLIATTGVRVSAGSKGTDFGPGFYTTTLERQARSWAWNLQVRKGGTAEVVYADVDRDDLAGLHHLAFVRGDFDAEDYWSFVVHCRQGATDHSRLPPLRAMYDVVSGPVAAFWQQRMLIAGADQISFHTPEAEAVLNAVSWSILP